MTTDLRAALRDLLTDRDEDEQERLSRIESGIRAITDAPPTVAELPRAVAIRGAETPAAERCPTCDREGCNGPFIPLCSDSICPDCAESRECRAHAVDWRARALAAEAWRAKVAPLIEELRRVAHSDDHDMMDVVEAVSPILAATDTTP